MKLNKEPLVIDNFVAPRFVIDSLELLKLLLWEGQSLPVDIFIARDPSNSFPF
jgi:hypothetical protein